MAFQESDSSVGRRLTCHGYFVGVLCGEALWGGSFSRVFWVTVCWLRVSGLEFGLLRNSDRRVSIQGYAGRDITSVYLGF